MRKVTRRRSQVAYAVCITALVILRTRESLPRIPADPNYNYVEAGRELGIRSLLEGDPYFHIASRAIGLLASMFPIGAHALALGVMSDAVWIGSSLVVSYAIRSLTTSSRLGMMAGLILALAPHAAESSIGCVGNVKWPLLIASVTLAASGVETRHEMGVGLGLSLLTGLSNPLALIATLPIALKRLGGRRPSRAEYTFVFVLIATLAIQVLKVGISSSAAGQSERVLLPWPGMGMFWWSGILAPVLFAGGTSILWIRSRYLDSPWPHSTAPFIIPSLTLWLSSYLLGGIADRYFVPPFVLGAIGALLALQNDSARRTYTWWCAATAYVVPLTVVSVKWFSVGWFMTTGPTWSAEVVRARSICERSAIIEVEVEVTAGATTWLPCSVLR